MQKRLPGLLSVASLTVASLAVAGAEKILRREIDAKAHADMLDAIKRQL